MPQSDPKPCVLLVEDDDAVRRSLLLLLNSRGYDVVAHADTAGLDRDPRALQARFLIADLLLPPTDAIQLLGALRAANWNGRAMLISGFLNKRSEAEALAAGYDVVLEKPLSETVLVRALERLALAPVPDAGSRPA